MSRHRRGAVQQPPGCLHSLTDDAFRSGELGEIDARVDVLDEVVSRVDPGALGRRHRRKGTKVVVGLVGVQTNQFARAQDLARQFKAEGFDVIIGGFHVSGAMAMAPTTPPECQELLDAGVTLVLGEVGPVGGILQDVLAGTGSSRSTTSRKPADWPTCLPLASPRTQRFFLAQNGTIDAGPRLPVLLLLLLDHHRPGPDHALAERRRHRRTSPPNYRLKGRRRPPLFTDDNFSRNPQWEADFDSLRALARVEGLDIDFMMQVDTQVEDRASSRRPRGPGACRFIGLESVRDDNLAAGASQNKAAEYRQMIARWRCRHRARRWSSGFTTPTSA
jgi:hypothetical protein